MSPVVVNDENGSIFIQVSIALSSTDHVSPRGPRKDKRDLERAYTNQFVSIFTSQAA
jgi:hypothetical protein